MSAKQPLSTKEISVIVDGFDPIDWVQVELLAKLPPEKRLISGLNAQEFSMSEINMRVLDYLTPVRME
jgi:hypothetical protein